MPSPAELFALLAIVCFVVSALGMDNGRGTPIGLVFLTLYLAFG
jgi:hypothetical protein